MAKRRKRLKPGQLAQAHQPAHRVGRLSAQEEARVVLLLDTIEALAESEDWQEAAAACDELVALVPDKPAALATLASTYAMAGYPALATEACEDVIERWPASVEARDLLIERDGIRSDCEEYAASIGLSGDGWFALACLNDRMMRHMVRGEWTEAREAAAELIANRPTFGGAYLHTSMALFDAGDYPEAIATCAQGLEVAPNDAGMLCEMVRLLVIGGRTDEALRCADRITALPPDVERRDYVDAQARGFIGDDEGVLAAFDRWRASGEALPETDQAYIHHWAAAAALRLGRVPDARAWWLRAARCGSVAAIAKDHLLDLDQLPEDRNGPWVASAADWLGDVAHDTLLDAAGEDPLLADPRAVAPRIRPVVAAFPHLVSVSAVLLNRSDPIGRMWGAAIALATDNDRGAAALASFALGRSGPDEIRRAALHDACVRGAVPPGVVPFWTRGAWDAAVALSCRVSTEARRIVPPAATSLLANAVGFLEADRPRDAEPFLLKHIEVAPDEPSGYQNLALAYELQGRYDKVLEIRHLMQDRFPDYLFGLVYLAKACTLTGDTSGAHAVLAPLVARPTLHPSELRAVADAYVALYEANGDASAAHAWADVSAACAPPPHDAAGARARTGKRQRRGRG